MKKILFPIDFSEASDNAFIYALEMAKLFKSKLVLLHTFDLPIVESEAMPLNYATIYDDLQMANFEHFRDEIQKLRALMQERNLEHIVMNHILMDGDLIYNIKKVIQQENIDFVIMGTNGVKNWFDSFLGTNAGAVISDVAVPVLSIPVESKFQKVQTIAFTTRFRKKDIEALVKVLLFARKMDAQVKCLYVKTAASDVTDETIKRWQSHFEDEKRLQFFIIPNENVKETIEDFLLGQDIDLLAILTYKRNFFVELFTTTTTQHLSYYLKTPILALHE
ncbi:universal stress protein [Flavobacterium sp.]|uniref:universal stress protein n=1 Tax=Flavobacterium sp. TaxID=239 RepID=UPI002488A640|nr:universal stress protein [Flavobacterium sp.]MDI1317082.1 universal stress protein [Flavobacterium sp.]